MIDFNKALETRKGSPDVDRQQLAIVERRTKFKPVYWVWLALLVLGTVVCWNNNTWMNVWAALVLSCSIVLWVRSFRQDRRDILLWLQLSGGWHYGLDLVKAGIASRGSVYVHLTRLQENRLIERRDEPEPDPRLPGPRQQFRAITGGVRKETL